MPDRIVFGVVLDGFGMRTESWTGPYQIVGGHVTVKRIPSISIIWVVGIILE